MPRVLREHPDLLLVEVEGHKMGCARLGQRIPQSHTALGNCRDFGVAQMASGLPSLCA
jgi:hypothetical protein